MSSTNGGFIRKNGRTAGNCGKVRGGRGGTREERQNDDGDGGGDGDGDGG